MKKRLPNDIREKILAILKSPLFQGIFLFLVLAALFLPYHRYQINVDGVSYLSIAQKYIQLDFTNAVNGYWSPLYSWLLIPLLLGGISPLLASKLLSIAIGLASLVSTNSILNKFNLNIWLHRTALFIMAIVVLFHAFNLITPDLLFACIGLALVNRTLELSCSNRTKTAVITGILGGLLYLSKSYGLPFFIVTFFLINVIFFFRTKEKKERNRVLKNYVLSMLLFLLIGGSWIMVLSSKYGYVTWNTSGPYNHAYIGPSGWSHPMGHIGLLPPPNETAISVWEDPINIPVIQWNIFENSQTFKYYRNTVWNNIKISMGYLNLFSLFCIPILAGILINLLWKKKKMFFEHSLLLLIFLFVSVMGYTLIVCELRYIILANFILILLGIHLLNIIFNKIPSFTIPKIVLVLVFSLSFIYQARYLYQYKNMGKEFYETQKRIASLNIHGKVASMKDWNFGQFSSFYHGWRYYGIVSSNSNSDPEAELKQYGIDYFIVSDDWEKMEQFRFLHSYDKVTQDSFLGFYIFKMK